jgi:hypothetical protein
MDGKDEYVFPPSFPYHAPKQAQTERIRERETERRM